MRTQNKSIERRGWLKTSFFSIMSLYLIPSIITSCRKEGEKAQKLSDLLDYSNVDDLKLLLVNANNITDLPGEFQTEGEKIMTTEYIDAFSSLDPSVLAQFYQNNLVLSENEVISLKTNDSTTFYNVLNRFFSHPMNIDKDLLIIVYLKIENNKYFNQYCPIKSGDFTNPYPNDIYNGILEIAAYIKSYRIDVLNRISLLASRLKSSSRSMAWPIVVIIIIIIVLWPTTMGDGELKHKGGSLG